MYCMTQHIVSNLYYHIFSTVSFIVLITWRVNKSISSYKTYLQFKQNERKKKQGLITFSVFFPCDIFNGQIRNRTDEYKIED